MNVGLISLLALILALVLLGVSIYGSVQMGTAFMPESDSNQIAVTMEMPKDSACLPARVKCKIGIKSFHAI